MCQTSIWAFSDDVLQSLFVRLPDVRFLIVCSRVNQQWRHLVSSSEIWQKLFDQSFGGAYDVCDFIHPYKLLQVLSILGCVSCRLPGSTRTGQRPGSSGTNTSERVVPKISFERPARMLVVPSSRRSHRSPRLRGVPKNSLWPALLHLAKTHDAVQSLQSPLLPRGICSTGSVGGHDMQAVPTCEWRSL